MYLVFLDIDGVFTSLRAHTANANEADLSYTKFDPVAVEFMNSIVDKVDDVKFVLTSSWKDMLPVDSGGFHWMNATFRNAGFRGVFNGEWHVDEDKKYSSDKRAEQVRDYIVAWQPKDYLIFDDDDFGYNAMLGKKRFIQTDIYEGISFDNMEHVNSIVGNWK